MRRCTMHLYFRWHWWIAEVHFEIKCWIIKRRLESELLVKRLNLWFYVYDYVCHHHEHTIRTPIYYQLMQGKVMNILTGWIPIEMLSKELQDERSVFRQTVIIQCFHAMGWTVKWRANCEQIEIKLFLLESSSDLCPMRYPYPSWGKVCFLWIFSFEWKSKWVK